jgi:WD40 repeat protein
LLYDLFEVLRQRLGGSGYDDNFNAKKAGSITSVDISHNGDVVIAGYTSGIIVLWDAIKGTVLRNINDSHPSPITSVRFLSDLKAVTVDAGGLVNKLTFSRNMLWSNYSMETECLLDGTAGQILAMNVLPPYSTVKAHLRPGNLSPVLKRLTLIALWSGSSLSLLVVIAFQWCKTTGRAHVLITMYLLERRTFLACPGDGV